MEGKSRKRAIRKSLDIGITPLGKGVLQNLISLNGLLDL